MEARAGFDKAGASIIGCAVMAERIAAILPAFNEEAALPGVLKELTAVGAAQIIVVDNGSSDETAAVARRGGTEVVSEPRRGYGQACLAGMTALRGEITVVVFMDADGSDDPTEMARLVGPIERGEAEMVLGSRVLGEREQGSLTAQQRFGNWLATRLMRFMFGARYTDLGPFRAIRRDALERLGMRDTNYGWTIEMQIKAHRMGIRVMEMPVKYRRRRGGQSKISGTLRGSVGAGVKILATIARYGFER